jgi:putative addiction module killer protein
VLKTYEVCLYSTEEGDTPFMEWLRGLKDVRGRAAIRERMDRLEKGNFGECRHIDGAVWELKLTIGPAYRIYYSLEGLKVILLLCGGDKRSQARDIDRAKRYWIEYRRRKNA